ncbi:MAG: helix-turn-helix transcriptional regulator [Kiritimatiellae bacterium]|nr:helix-turn-helix transcriptional regulator [Kiritimatiellia bacterium]
MESFRAVFDESEAGRDGRFSVHVIGYRLGMTLPVDIAEGVRWWFIFMFYDRLAVRAAGGWTQVPPGTMVICPPRQPLGHGAAGSRWVRSWIRCGGTEVGPAVAEADLPVMTPLVFRSHAENERHLLGIHRELNHPRGADPRTVLDLFRVWMRGIRRECRGTGPRVPAAFLRARQFVETHYRDGFTLDELAASCALSKSHLCRGFRRHFGTSPVALAIRIRLDHAGELLRNADLNVTQVGRECGFSDVYYFSRLFKKHMGLSPRGYRQAGAP